MTAERHYDAILRPVITEKATLLSENGKIVFEVRRDAAKKDIARAIETLFKVKVEKVNTMVTKGKAKRFRGTKGRRSDVKKAVVTLAEGYAIDVATGL